MLRALLLCLPLLLLAACGSPPKVNAAGEPISADPETALYEKIKAARYQIGIATDRLEATVHLAQGMAQGEEAEVREALNLVAASLASAGSLVAEYDEEPPALEAFKATFAEQDEARLKAIEACNSAHKSVMDAATLADELLASEPPEDAKKALTEIRAGINEAEQALKDAVTEMNGVLEAAP